jgi:hypothetical protein
MLAATLLAIAVLCSQAAARRWTTVTGQTFEAEFVRVEGENGIFRVASGREDPYPLNRLSVADRLLIGRTVHAQGGGAPSSPATATPAAPIAATPARSTPAPAAAPTGNAAGALQFAGQPLTAGGSSVVEIEVSDAALLKELKEAYGKPSTRAKMLIALPNGFAPTPRNYPILIVSSTTDGDASSIGSARANYLPDATEKGFVVIAVDGEHGKPSDQGRDSTDFRWALVQAGLAAIQKEWPNAKKWPIATAGISGGGGYASHQAMLLLDKQYPLIGLLLSATGWTPGDFPDVTRRAPRAAVRTLPVFFTAGEKDTIATPEMTQKAHGELTGSGFKNVRYEKFDGGHVLHRPHLQQALEWFVAEYKKSAGGPSVL